MRTFRTLLVVAIILTGYLGAAERRVPSFADVVEFTADPIPSAPSDHFRDFKINRDSMKTILETHHVVTRERWLHDYHHVAGADRTGTLTLKDKTTIRWLVRPGGLASLTFPDQAQIYLAKEAKDILTEAQVRELAAKYRDEWVAKNHPGDSSFLARGIIRKVERTSDGWHVVFVTETGHNPTTPEGMHDYYLHVFVKASGELERIERGPDLLS